jgi:hypothetical protein
MSASDGFVLQQNPTLLSPDGWTDFAGTINDDGTNRSITVFSTTIGQLSG